MTDTPKDGDLGAAEFGDAVQYNGTDWLDWYGSRNNHNITPTGERAISIKLCEDAAVILRRHGYPGMADTLDPPTPTPDEPRWPENTIVNYGDSEYLYIVNADGVPCSRRGIRTGFPLDSDWWRVVGTFTPKGDA